MYDPVTVTTLYFPILTHNLDRLCQDIGEKFLAGRLPFLLLRLLFLPLPRRLQCLSFSSSLTSASSSILPALLSRRLALSLFPMSHPCLFFMSFVSCSTFSVSFRRVPSLRASSDVFVSFLMSSISSSTSSAFFL